MWNSIFEFSSQSYVFINRGGGPSMAPQFCHAYILTLTEVILLSFPMESLNARSTSLKSVTCVIICRQPLPIGSQLCRADRDPLRSYVDIIGWFKKMAQLLIRHSLQSGLHSHMKLHTRQLQHIQSQRMNFQLNLTKNMEMSDVLKKGV